MLIVYADGIGSARFKPNTGKSALEVAASGDYVTMHAHMALGVELEYYMRTYPREGPT